MTLEATKWFTASHLASVEAAMASGGKIQVAWIPLSPASSAAWSSRWFVIDTLRRFGLLGALDDVQLVVSELVANAVAASAAEGTAFTVCLRAEEGSLFIEVGDHVEALPALRRPTLEHPYGWGLFLVASMSERWGVYQEDDGKVIWSELSCVPRDE
ncbi:ATP-binding protein [Streptomyces sp. NPDC059017]|uniref:ATP-binding protein n=1 Tax=Streptomyces sp. NPDC059017 TaxID=3346700 RepID=UPI0036C96FAE